MSKNLDRELDSLKSEIGKKQKEYRKKVAKHFFPA